MDKNKKIGATRRVPERAHFILIPHTHWDREWYLPFEEFRHRLVNMLDKLIKIMESNPAYGPFHLDGQTIALEDYEAVMGRSEPLRRLIKEGRIKPGPWYVLPDEFLVSGEALIRNLERGFAVCRSFGAEPVKCGYLPDMFGHIAQMPQILKGFGLSFAVVWRGVPTDVTGSEFFWEAPDQSRVFAVFLPAGYGSGANLPDTPELLIERLSGLLVLLEAGENSRVLLMNGSDHAEPQARVPEAMHEVCRQKPGWTWEFGDLESWVDGLVAGEPPDVIHSGEMRSADRTLILPGVASARVYLKRLDFLADAGLARRAEPLCALARALGGPDRTDFLDYAWRLLLQNHPHDSICGCSVDEVHDEMETRYQKVLQVSGRVFKESMSHVLDKMELGGPALVVYNPAGATTLCVLNGVIEGRIRHAMALGDKAGEAPLQILETVEPEARLLDVKLPRSAGAALLAELAGPELFGLYLNRVKLSVKGDLLEVRMDAGQCPSGIDVQGAKDQIEAKVADPEIRWIRIRVNRLSKQRVMAMVSELPGYSVNAFQLIKRKGSRGPEVEVGQNLMENEHVKLQFEPGGTCLLTDKESGLGYRCLRFLDVGDRGDTYNFDPVPGDSPICEPEKVALKSVTTGPVAAVMEIRHRFRIPERLHRSRKARSRKRAPLDLTTWVTMYKGHPRVDLRTTFTNPARDHRLQTAVRIPYEADAFKVESAFAMVERPVRTNTPPGKSRGDLMSMLLGREGTYSTSPQKTAALVSNGDHGLAVMNRGMAEIDAVKLNRATRIAMTMVRSVGWLSRGDLDMRRGEAGPPLPTPGAQCLRTFTWEYALMPFHGRYAEGDMIAAAHAFAYPPGLFMVPAGRGMGERCFRLVDIDNPRVYAGVIRPLPEGEVEVRVVNSSWRDECCTIGWGKWWTKPRLVNFRGDPVECDDILVGDNRVEAELRPGQIITIRLSV
jgi:hypothetical protein